MAKRFIRTTSENFNNLSDKSEYNDSIVFIEDINQIWSNGVYYVYIPEKGVDYFTDDDKEQFIEDITPIMQNKIEEIIGDVDLDGNATSIDYTSNMATTHGVTNVNDALDKLLNKVYYVGLSLSYSSGGGTYLIGSTQNIIITAVFNKVPNSITINGETIVPSKTITKTYSNITTDQTYELIAYSKDAENNTINISKKFFVSFANYKYYGVSSDSNIIEETIKEMSKEVDIDRKGDFTVTANDGQYIYFAVPKRYGEPLFSVGGFENGFHLLKEINITNAYNYNEIYLVYESDQPSLGTTTVKVN